MDIWNIDFSKIFHLESSPAELVLRGSVLYIGILALLRILPRRTGGELETMDLVFVILIAEAATHSLGDYTSITDSFIIILTIVGWNYMINIFSYYFPVVERIVSAPAIEIIRNGKLIRKNMRREYITELELLEHLRSKGIDRIEDVKSAFVESDGQISVITF
ncbi:MAG TPA: YetF domain-containing protein [Cytophagaceae bacterium]